MILAMDIGGTAVKMGLLQEDGIILARKAASVCFDQYKTPILTTVLKTASDFLEEQNAEIEGIGVSATGQIDVRTGVVAGTNGMIPNYEGSDLAGTLSARFRVPVHVLNDANAAALGECFLGAGRGASDVLMITLGTGVGGGIILGGRVYVGANGFAGEMGHFTLYQDGLPCTCGKRGCFEQYASARALAKKAGVGNGKIVFERIQSGNVRMRTVFIEWLEDVSAGITGLVHIFNPSLVLIGGGISEQEEWLIAPLRKMVLSGVMPRFAEHLRIEKASLGNDAGMLGALRFWLDQERVRTNDQ